MKVASDPEALRLHLCCTGSRVEAHRPWGGSLVPVALRGFGERRLLTLYCWRPVTWRRPYQRWRWRQTAKMPAVLLNCCACAGIAPCIRSLWMSGCAGTVDNRVPAIDVTFTIAPPPPFEMRARANSCAQAGRPGGWCRGTCS